MIKLRPCTTRVLLSFLGKCRDAFCWVLTAVMRGTVMRQYVTVEKQEDSFRARVIQVESGLFGEHKFTEDEITGPKALVRIYLQANYPGLDIEAGSELLEE